MNFARKSEVDHKVPFHMLWFLSVCHPEKINQGGMYINKEHAHNVREGEMATVTIPTSFEAHLALGDGSAGATLSEVLQLTSSQVPNLYSCSSSQFTYCFQVLKRVCVRGIICCEVCIDCRL